MPPARPKSVHLPVRRAPGSKFGCMSLRIVAFRIDSGQLRFAMMCNLNCYPTSFKSWNLATASDGQNVTLARGGSSLLPYRKPTPSGEPVRLIRPIKRTGSLCLEFIGLRAARVNWKVSSLPFFYSVQYSMERKSTKRRLNQP